ncbi:hypothetical protein XA68_15989 [Ophiocordyceps unilateralis]|uniref:Uncharacterized protein n=1 Tax=Ophiocordyceps unilateralis TaxID=268505 RepID=A0A2A9PLE4_OPHUN|nr:hypothetical protein XA68_15989 [Ophiocordyceps unilateralis]
MFSQEPAAHSFLCAGRQFRKRLSSALKVGSAVTKWKLHIKSPKATADEGRGIGPKACAACPDVAARRALRFEWPYQRKPGMQPAKLPQSTWQTVLSCFSSLCQAEGRYTSHVIDRGDGDQLHHDAWSKR